MRRKKPIVMVKVKKKVPAREIVTRINRVWKNRFKRERNTLYYENKRKRIKAKWTVTTDRVIRVYQDLKIPQSKKGDREFIKKMQLNKKYMVIRTLVGANLMKHPSKLRRQIYELERILKQRYTKKKTIGR